MRLTKKQIIDETANFYAEDTSRRGYNEFSQSCVYRDPSGNMCAVGRCIDPKHKDSEEAYDLEAGADYFLKVYSDSILKEKYQGHSKSFWYDLQLFHDPKAHFHLECGEGLTDKGAEFLKSLHKKWDHQ